MDAQQRIAELEATVAAKDEIIAAQQAHITQLEQRLAELLEKVAGLTEQVAVLTERLRQDSSNSHKPPSSDPPGSGKSASKARRKGKKKRKRKRGGQPGHKGHHRELVPEGQVDEFVDYFPPQCESCWKALSEVADPGATRFQVTEVPPVQPHITEYRCHEVQCSCGYRTRGRFGPEVPSSPFGARLMSIVALLTGVYNESRRKTVSLLSELLGVRISLGAVSAIETRVSDAVKPPVEEAWTKLSRAGVKHTDGTGWLQAG